MWFGMSYVCCGTVRCATYLNVVTCAWREVECGRDVEWCAEMWWSDLAGANYGVMSVYVKCGAMLNVAISDMVRLIEMQNVYC